MLVLLLRLPVFVEALPNYTILREEKFQQKSPVLGHLGHLKDGVTFFLDKSSRILILRVLSIIVRGPREIINQLFASCSRIPRDSVP
jgi:hypothetical protein